jgi:putative hydrolase of the HAD superfamily
MPQAWQRIAAYALERIDAPDNGLSAAVAEDYAERRRQSMDLFPDSVETLEALRRSGVPLGLVTNGDKAQQRDKIERFRLERFFDVIVIEGEFGAGKPDAAVFEHALSVIKVAPSSAAMVGDHLEFDVAGPQALGLTGIWIDRRARGLGRSPVRPHRIVKSLRELL